VPVFVLTVLLATVVAPFAQPDVTYRERHIFTIPAPGHGDITEDVEVSVTYHTARSAAGGDFSVYEQYFNRVTDFEVEIDGRGIRRREFRTTQAQSEDVFLSGGTIHSVAPPEPIRPGQTVVQRYRRTYPDAAYLPILYVPSVDRLARYEIVVRHPEGIEAGFAVTPSRHAVPFVSTPGARESRLLFLDLPEAPPVPHLDGEGVHAAVQLHLRAGDRNLTPTTPTDFAAWYGSLVGRVDTTATPRLRALAESLRRESPSATIAAIHDHVRRGIRYVADARGESAFVPRAPDIVLDRAYGDCKDRAWLVATLARILGHRVDLVLTSTEPTPPVPGVALGLYNHVVCAFGEGEDRVVFDPTHPHLPYGALPDALVGARSLRFGSAGAEEVRFVAQDSLPSLDVTVRLDLDQAASSEATIVLRGEAMAAVREARLRGTPTDAANVVSAIAGDSFYRVRLSNLSLSAETNDALQYRASADLSQFVVASPTRRYLPLTPFPAVPTDAPLRRADELPLDLPTRPNLRLRVHVASGWTATPRDEAWGDDLAGFRAHLTPADDGIQVTYRFWQQARHLAGDARTAYLDLADRYLGARRDVLTFSRPSE